ncbi:MAG: MurR/RpiR family transcriptional regulator [Rhizobiaceae bacterium]|nr:MurR/RpiR family transcriptional regulator [Rhizobiaceae bacterium]
MLRLRGNALPKRLKQCAEYVAANPAVVAVSTVAELAAGAQVPPSAFMRFCQEMGFSGFSEMQKLFREEYSQNWPDYASRLSKLRNGDAQAPQFLLAEFAEAGRTSIESLTRTIDPDALRRAVAVLAGARTIHLVGLRRTFPVATYLAYAFEKMQIPAILHSGTGNLSSAHLIGQGDALIAISFAPYTPDTIALAESAVKRNADVVVITDLPTSPLARIDAVRFMVPEVDVGAFRSLSATLTLAMTLAVGVGTQRRAL